MKRDLQPQLANVMAKIRECIDSDNYVITNHGVEREEQRLITVPDILYVLRNGWHEKEKTGFSVKYQAWNYAIRGNTIDNVDLRIIVAFSDTMVVVTVIKITKKR